MIRPVYLAAYYLSGYVGATCCFSLKVEGEPIERGPILVIGKHVSNWDIPVISRAVRKLVGNFPHFEMGSFHGYAVLGKVIVFLKWCGGFPVMRSKDLMRLRHTSGQSKEELRQLMRDVNEEAAEVRRQVIREGQAMCFFPEGTRDRSKVNRLRSVHEVEEALELIEKEGVNVRIVPIIPCYGRKPKPFIPFLRRRPVVVKMLPPLSTEGRSAREVLAEAQILIEAHWSSENDVADPRKS
ncbi:MAG: 1-acyl-sn-glycerol-3-phosphate acyltransferase [Planctomycetota bacterium]|jgi:1-acyl-sn-glycerol-3-phosphate acyltransferase